MSKTHYAQVENATEYYNKDEWTKTICGLEYTESPLTNKQKYVTCKHCLRMIKKHFEGKNKWYNQ